MTLNQQTLPSPTRWGAYMTVMHRITGRRGLVLRVDFEEDVVLVRPEGDGIDGVEGWRTENVFEVPS